MPIGFALTVDRPFKNLSVNWCYEKPDLFHLRDKSDPRGLKVMLNFRLCIRVVPLKGIERALENTMTLSFNPRKNQRTSKVMDVLEL